MSVPVIETERLRLRGHRLDDFEDCLAMWTDPEVTRYITGKPSTRQETWARLLRYAGHWQILGYGYWVVEEKATGAFVGELGFADWKREMQPPPDAPELGWALATHAAGKGYATEALRAALAWGDTHFEHTRTVCIISPDNTPSIRVAEKCGFHELERITYNGTPTILFAREARATK